MFRLAADRVAFKLTAFDSMFSQRRFAHHARQLVRHTDLDALLWAILSRREITFSSLLAEKWQKNGGRKI
jgi:hypothetical protein